jgi:Tetratricopeptide repeat
LGESHPDVALTQTRLASMYQALGRYEDAERLLLPAYRAYQATLGETHEITQGIIKQLVELYDAWGKRDSVEEWRARQSKQVR